MEFCLTLRKTITALIIKQELINKMKTEDKEVLVIKEKIK